MGTFKFVKKKKMSALVGLMKEKLAIFCFCFNKNRNGGGMTGKHRYGSLGGKYDESDEEDAKGMLYTNNLQYDDDDDEEEQIVILTKEKTAKAENRKPGTPAPAVDHSVF